MSATRLLVLGVVRMYGKAHGYRVGCDLLSWGAGEWANVKWGSIYHALKQLAKEGLLGASDAGKQHQCRTDYAMTPAGDSEFFRLLRDALRQPEYRPDLLGASLVLLPALPRAEAIALLGERLAALEAQRDEMAKFVEKAGEGGVPPHVRELFGLWTHSADSGIDWTRGLIIRLEGGAYAMAGEGDAHFGSPGCWSTAETS